LFKHIFNGNCLMFAHIKLQYLLFITFTLISSIPVLLLTAWVQQAALEQEIEAVQEKHLLVAQNITGDLSRYITDVDSSFQLIASNLQNNTLSTGFSEHIESLFIRYVSIVKDDATITNTVSVYQHKLSHFDATILNQLKPILKKSSLSPNIIFYSNVMKDEYNNPTFYLIKSLNNNTFVIASLSTKHIIDAQKMVVFGKRGHAAIVDKVGRVIAHPIKNWIDTMKDLSSLAPVKFMIQEKTGVTQFFSPALKADMIAGYTFVPKVGWGVMIPQPFEELEAQAANVRQVAFLITLFGIAVASIIAWLLANVLSRPILSVVESAKIQSESNTLSKATTQFHFLPFEFKELLASFNRMVDVIKDKTALMQETSNRLSEAQRIAHIGNWEWNIEQDSVWCSREFYRICDIVSANFNDDYQSLINLIHPDDKEMVTAALQKVKRQGGRFKLSHRILLPQDKECYVYHEGELHIGTNGQNQRIIGIIHDITDRKRYESEIKHQANYDDLTKLPNRILLIDRLKQETRTAKRDKLKFGLLSIDLDNFKLVNDTYGHVIGDKLLKGASVRLLSCIRDSDTLARLGGDEFCIILRDIKSEEDCSIVANKIILNFKNAFSIEGCESFIGTSIGISLFPNDSEDADTLIRNADIALYRVKETERNNYCFYKEEMDQEITNRMSLTNDLHKALDRNEFSVYYQPIIDLKTGLVSSAEALIRWKHPQRGFISPDAFIPLAEKTGLIAPLGEWVLRTACHNAANWSQLVNSAPRLSVNLSVRQLQLDFSKEDVEKILKQSGLAPSHLIFEITESLVMHDSDQAISWMNSVRELGVTFSIDDFGTGYSSLSYLKKLPVTNLKIDREFIKDVVHNAEDASLVKTIIAIGQSLHLKIIAEGVEQEQQLNYLRKIGCDYIQGYYYSKPLPAEDFVTLLRNWKSDSKLLNFQQ